MSSSPRSVNSSSGGSPRKRNSGVVAVANVVRDPHSTLGVSVGASKHEIKKAYRRLALQYHPDVCNGNHCTTSFQQINSAYEVWPLAKLAMNEFPLARKPHIDTLS